MNKWLFENKGLRRYFGLNRNQVLILFRSPSDFKWLDRENMENDGDGSSFYVSGVLRDCRCGSRVGQRSRLGKVVNVDNARFFSVVVVVFFGWFFQVLWWLH